MPPPAYPSTEELQTPAGIARLGQMLYGNLAPQGTAASDIARRLVGADIFPSFGADFAEAAKQSEIASKLSTQADIDAQSAGLQAGGARYLYDQIQGIQAPQEGAYPQPNQPTLQLPDQPQTARPQVNPLAQLLSIGASLASPSSAGGFHAAALEGAIRGAQEENARRQQVYKNDVTSRTLLYDASMQQAKERQRVSEANVDAASRSSVAEHSRQLLLAKAKSETFTAGKLAEHLADFADEHDPQFKARDRVKAILDNIDRKGALAAEDRKGIAELLGVLNKEDAPGNARAKALFEAIMKGVQEGQAQKATDARVTKVAGMQEKAAMARTQVQQSGETQRTSMNIVARMNQMLAEQNAINKRFEANLNANKIPQNLKESIENRTRLQGVLKQAEETLQGAKTDLTSIQGGANIAGMDRHNGGLLVYNNRLDSAQRHVDAVQKALREEQERSVKLDPKGGAKGVYDPATGDFNIR